MTSVESHFALRAVLLLFVLTGVASGIPTSRNSGVVGYFDTFINNTNVTDFTQLLSSAIQLPTSSSIFVMNFSTITTTCDDPVCRKGVDNSTEPLIAKRRINFTFVGDVKTAQEMSSALTSLSTQLTASLGILALRATATPYLLGKWNETLLLCATLFAPNASDFDLGPRLAKILGVTTNVFQAATNTTATTSNYTAGGNLTSFIKIVGSNTHALAEKLMGLSPTTLEFIGASHFSILPTEEAASVTPPAGSSDATSTLTSSTIGGFVILGGVLFAGLLMLAVHWQRGGFDHHHHPTTARFGRGGYFSRRRAATPCEVVVIGVVVDEMTVPDLIVDGDPGGIATDNFSAA
ncbi:membrane-associated protein, putative [Bodo saltans]|uniref:Membrane-associated protein, putative n=1 Tax=Bodo saltans TaxID=75058 RepID=A0A0S4IPM1_BODSA|nr:membrane-associated protein, putative [Bodo saltans]|eukprot:CUF87780.1 membrane-associated protein, putative [Bodo saltans]